MLENALYLPILTLFIGGVIAALFGLPALNKRLSPTALSWGLALFPLAALLMVWSGITAVNAEQTFTTQLQWIPSLDYSLSLYFDSLSALFTLLITTIGTVIIVYTGQYFKGDDGAWRMLSYLLFFMTAMMGIVMAGDVLTLFIFWEATSILSFLLVAYKTESKTARYGAFRALFITGGGGIALLIGLLFISNVAGGTDFATILSSHDLLIASPLYPIMFGLLALGAFTKSAQWPFHIWLPGAMSAPTPASAYLHSATMVKAGIYLMARMYPAMGDTDLWLQTLTIVGVITMLMGAYLGLKQHDLKALLAYSTISQLGILMALIGQETGYAFKALIIGIVAHALYKSALFLVAGIVDHATGTRDIRRLGGLAKVMPYTAAVAALAALSMAGLPPLFGFLAKETLLKTAVDHPTEIIFIKAAIVLTGSLMLAQGGLFFWETFMGKPKDAAIHPHKPSTPMWMMPAVPALLSLFLSILPGSKDEATLLAGAATAAFGDAVKVNTQLYHGLTTELWLSVVAISLGFIIFWQRHRVRDWQNRLSQGWSINAGYAHLLAAIDKAAFWATRLQMGNLRTYLVIMLATALAMVIGFGWDTFTAAIEISNDLSDIISGTIGLRLFTLLLIVTASLASVVLRRDFFAVLAFGAAGLAMALFFTLEPAPGVALVQIVVDILSIVILTLALTRLPRPKRKQAQAIHDAGRRRKNWKKLWRDGIISAVFGLVVAVISFTALTSRPRTSAITPAFEELAASTGAKSIVGAIVVDFRALDTLIEIAVFSIAGLGIYVLLHYAAKKHGDTTTPSPVPRLHFLTRGLATGVSASSFLRVPVYVMLPIAVIYAATQLMYGHNQPGDGFTAGVTISLSVGLWYVVFGYDEARRRLPWLKRPSVFIGTGVLLAVGTGLVAAGMTGNFLGNFDFTAGWHFLPYGFHVSTSFLFEVAICLTVFGSVTHMLNGLGHPESE